MNRAALVVGYAVIGVLAWQAALVGWCAISNRL